MSRSFSIDPRPAHRPGFRLKLFENGAEIAGEVYPAELVTEEDAYEDALAAADLWLAGKTKRSQ
jgi:hypothetical protein